MDFQNSQTGNKMRPIINNIGSPTYKISKWLNKSIKRINNFESLQIENSLELKKIEDSLKLLNLQSTNIKFTKEIEDNKQIPFLDLKLVTNEEKRKIEFRIHRKETHMENFIKSTGLVNFTLNEEDFKHEKKHIIKVARENGFDEKMEIHISPWVHNKFQNIFEKFNIKLAPKNNYSLNKLIKTNKNEKTDKNKKSGIYQIECMGCEKIYIGKTKRNLKIRTKEHIRILKMEKLKNLQLLLMFDTKLLKQLENTNELTIWEKIYIQKNRNRVMNFDIPMEGDLVWRFFGQPQDGADIDIQDFYTPMESKSHVVICREQELQTTHQTVLNAFWNLYSGNPEPNNLRIFPGFPSIVKANSRLEFHYQYKSSICSEKIGYVVVLEYLSVHIQLLKVAMSSSSTSNNSTEKKQPKLLKILCLHGYRQSGEVFRQKLGGLRKALKKHAELVFITAPNEVPPSQESLLIHEDTNAMEQYAWWFSTMNKTFDSKNPSNMCIGFEESLNLIERTFEEEGPFDGILGFSQGACFVGLLCGMQETNMLNFEFGFAILVAGFTSLCLAHSNYYVKESTIPTLHIYGDGDNCIIRERSEDLLQYFEDAEVMLHQGGHYVPSSPAQRQGYIEFLEKRIKELTEQDERKKKQIQVGSYILEKVDSGSEEEEGKKKKGDKDNSNGSEGSKNETTGNKKDGAKQQTRRRVQQRKLRAKK
ncbi:hypothetical protein L9F63_013986 [Diploptera punctata]|uniref:GIY-YIG domain-containing protein n=1 Tax=Diploptera punctata TaxID=6984 RepID=A0AAD8A924_DIPPU|nr:hypothetical protein L9F63_013986 [Diploptera punctata]